MPVGNRFTDFSRRRKLSARSKARMRELTHRDLDDSLEQARNACRVLDAANDKIIVLSDHHRGKGDGADDFRPCVQTYHQVLEHYHAAGYELVLLGDVEELWEATWPRIENVYRETLALEKRFADENRYIRLYGNHDHHWGMTKKVERHLRPWIGTQTVLRALCLEVEGRGTLFLTHGDQGKRYGSFAINVVKYIWANIQRGLKNPLNGTTPSGNVELKHAHEENLYEWARGKGNLVLICGHTHRPVFFHGEAMKTMDAAAEDAAGRTKLADLQIHAPAYGLADGAPKPVYFNTGCCSFGDGGVTGIEISGGRLAFVRALDGAIQVDAESSIALDSLFE